jgi:hypothetical protein
MHDEYWNKFIPAMLLTRLGSSTDGNPQLAAAWLGWQERRKLDDVRIRELESEIEECQAYRCQQKDVNNSQVQRIASLEAKVKTLKHIIIIVEKPLKV